MRRSSVLLPQPDGPISETNSPGRDREVDAGERVAPALGRPGLNVISMPSDRRVDGGRRRRRVGRAHDGCSAGRLRMKRQIERPTRPATTRPSTAAPSMAVYTLAGSEVASREYSMISRPIPPLRAGRDLGDDGADHRGRGGQLQRRDQVRHRGGQPQLHQRRATSRRRRSRISSTDAGGRRLQAAQRADGDREEREVGGDHRRPTSTAASRDRTSDSWPPQPDDQRRQRHQRHGLADRITYGQQAALGDAKRCITMARPRPTATPITKPTMATRNVNHSALQHDLTRSGVLDPRSSGSPKRLQDRPTRGASAGRRCGPAASSRAPCRRSAAAERLVALPQHDQMSSDGDQRAPATLRHGGASRLGDHLVGDGGHDVLAVGLQRRVLASCCR